MKRLGSIVVAVVTVVQLGWCTANATEGGNDPRATSFAVFPGPASFSAAYQNYPYSTIGVLCANFPAHNRSGECCTGSVLNANNKSVVMTAGHCLLSRDSGFNEWGTNIVFFPQYYSGVTPQGTWNVRAGGLPGHHDGYQFVTIAYQNSGASNHDVGFAVMATQGGTFLQDRVGSLGWNFNNANGAIDQLHTLLGYPVVGGSQPTQQGCTSPRLASVSFPDQISQVQIACNREPPGSSGAPSLTRFSGVSGPTTDVVVAANSTVNYSTFDGDGNTLNFLTPLDMNEAFPQFQAAVSR